jgi:DNA glycosylase AlkZ-like
MARATSRTTVESTSWDEALAWRLYRHHLVTRARRSKLLDVVGDICGLHAQVLSSAELSLWVRIDGLERTAVQDLLWKRRALVKLWAMRGTLHLLPSRELGFWISALSTQEKYGNVGSEEMEVLTEAVARALDGRALTREELALEVARYTGSDEYGEFVRFSWGSYLKAASFRGLICFAPSNGNNVRFTSPATWIRGRIDRIDREEAFRDLIRRFLRAYGPATSELLALWSGRSLRVVRKRLAELEGEIVQLDVEGLRTWMLARDRRALMGATPPKVARLLPAFDPWVLGASRVEGLVDPSHRALIYRPQGWISPVVLVDGRITGVWKHTSKGRRLVVEVKPFGRLPAWARDEIESEAERLAAFLGGRLELEVA